MLSKKYRKIRVLFLGDSKTGKTSIIKVLSMGKFFSTIEPTLDPILLPIEYTVPPFYLNTILVDTSNDPTKTTETNEEITKADVIFLVYEINSTMNVKNLSKIWLPRIMAINSKVPVILIGNKSDIQDGQTSNMSIQYEIKTILSIELSYFLNTLQMQHHITQQIETGIECSAATNKNLIEALFLAQRAYIFPTRPLYNPILKGLTEQFENALRNIFNKLDMNNEGRLDDQKIRHLQNLVFKKSLGSNELSDIKKIFEKSGSDITKGLSLKDFLELNKQFIENEQVQICWEILNQFGYYTDGTQIQRKEILEANKSKLLSSLNNGISYLNHTLKQPWFLVAVVITILITSFLTNSSISSGPRPIKK